MSGRLRLPASFCRAGCRFDGMRGAKAYINAGAPHHRVVASTHRHREEIK